jgi:ABC-2 type transport system permease protein
MIRLLKAYFVWSFLQQMTWRGFMLTLVINQIVTPVIGLAVWSAALPGDPAITRYYLALFIVQLMTVSQENHTLSNGIYDGRIASELLKPHPPVLRVLGDNLSIRCWHLALGAPIFAVLMLAIRAPLDPRLVLIALPAVALAAALCFLYTYTLASLAFWTQQAHAAVIFGTVATALLGGSAFPIDRAPEPLRGIAGVLPFSSMLGFPARVASAPMSVDLLVAGYATQLLWIAAFAGLARLVWRLGVRQFTATGG